MSTSFIIAIEAGTTVEQSDLTSYLQGKGWRYWHWIDDLWIASGLPPETTTAALWNALIGIPSLTNKTMIIIGVDGPMKYFGRTAPDGWKWLAESGHLVGR